LARGYHPAVRVVLVVLVVLAGCSFSTKIDTQAQPDDATTSEPDATVIDARTLAACPTAAANCQLLTSSCLPVESCYYRCTTNRNWEDARVRCQADGMGCLVTLDSAAENTCIATTLNAVDFNNHYWIGYRQTHTTVEPAGNWAWVCGTSTFTPSPPWGLPPPVNEPNDNAGNEDCAMVLNNFGHWNDAGCGDGLDYVCEFPR
jgi:hypothetical protein